MSSRNPFRGESVPGACAAGVGEGATGPMLGRRGLLGTIAMGAVLAGCAGPTLNPFGDSQRDVSAPTGDTIGTGAVRVALLLPLSAANGAGPARSLRNAAELAAAEFAASELSISVRDDRGTTEGAVAAAREAMAEGAELLIGPLFAPSVQAAGNLAKAAGRPMIAFSSDSNAGSKGVYLLSFLPQSDVQRIVGYASQQGKKGYAALIPQTAYGNVAEAEFVQAVSQRGGRVVASAKYQSNTKASIEQAIAQIKASEGQFEALFIPEGGEGMPAVAAALATAGMQKTQLLGTGVWNDPRLYRLPAMQGAWFASPDGAGFNAFAARYRAKFGADPTRIATLGYDAVALAAALSKRHGSQRFTESVLTNPDGFAGQDGVFRFRPDGLNERALAILEIRGTQAVVRAPAPQSFAVN